MSPTPSPGVTQPYVLPPSVQCLTIVLLASATPPNSPADSHGNQYRCQFPYRYSRATAVSADSPAPKTPSPPPLPAYGTGLAPISRPSLPTNPLQTPETLTLSAGKSSSFRIRNAETPTVLWNTASQTQPSKKASNSHAWYYYNFRVS